MNKCDTTAPLGRNRDVAMEFADRRRDELWPQTPPFEALRLLVSITGSGRAHGRGGRKILLMDPRLHAAVYRLVDAGPT